MSSMGIAGMLPFRSLTHGMRELRRWLASKIAVNSKAGRECRPSPEESLTPSARKKPSFLSKARLLFSILIAISSFTGIAQAQHAPTIFYNVPNWTLDYLHVKYATPLDAFVIPWDSMVPHCYNGQPGYNFAGIVADHVSGYPDGSLYDALYYGKNAATCVVDGGPYHFGSAARRYAHCSMTDAYGNPADQWGYAAEQFPNGMCPKPAVDPEKNRGVPTCPCKLVADPVNPSTGNKYESIEIYRGQGPFPLSFAVSYNSLNGNSDIQIQSDLVVGARRVHNYLRMIRLHSNSLSATAYALRPDGKVLGFNQSGTNWIADADVSDTLLATYASDGSIDGWLYTTNNGDQELYNGAGQLISLTTKGGLTQTLLYNADGTLASVSDPSGRQLSFSYDSAGRISTLQAPDGSTYTLRYDSNNNLKTVTYPDSNILTLVYGENGAGASDLTGVIDESSTRIDTTQYDSSHRAVSTTGPNGIGQTTIGYNFNSGTLVGTVTDALGKVETSSTEYLLGTVRPLQITRTCAGCTTASMHYNYDNNGYLTSSTDYNGNTTKTTYESNGLLDQKIDAFGTSSQRTTNFTWNTALRIPLTRAVLDANNNTVSKTQWVYNGTGQTLARCDIDPTNNSATGYSCSNSGAVPAGVRRWTYTYCTAVNGTNCPLIGLLLTATGPRTDLTQTTSYSYYMTSSATGCGTPGAACHQIGDLQTVTDALGHVTTIASYDGAGRITRTTDPNGVNTDMTYTPRGWLSTRTAGGAKTTFGYKPYGAVSSITDPDGVITTFGYDDAHRLNKITDALGNYIQYTLNATGDKAGEQIYDSAGTLHKSISRQFNALGQLTKVIDGLSQTVFSANYTDSYDGNGNLVHAANALGIQRKQSYDPLNRLIGTIDNYNGSDPSTTNTQSAFTYDANDRIEGVGDPDGLNTIYGYDGLGNSTSLQSPDTGTTSRSFDAAGNLTQSIDARGVVVQYAYDALDRRTKVIYPAHPALNVTYTYDQANPIPGCPANYNIGHLTSMTDASGSTAWCYTNQGDIREVSQVINGVTYLHGYAYTNARRLVYLQYPSGFELIYGHDGDGRVSSINYVQQPGPFGSYANQTPTPLITSVAYLPFGPMSGYVWALNGEGVTRTYDANYRLTDLVSSALNLHYRLDALGRIQAEGNASGVASPNETFQYDPLDRLKELDGATGALEESYTYTPGGDRLTQTIAGPLTSAYTYQAGTHRLSSVAGAMRQLDANGNTTTMTDPLGAQVGLVYDDRNLLTSVQNSGSTIANYQYNGLGIRSWRTITYPMTGQAATIYDPMNSGNLFGEYFAADYREFVYLNGVVVASATDAGRYVPAIMYDHVDGLGSLRVETDTAGNFSYGWAWNDNAFGAQAKTGNGNLYLRFPGQYYDVETGLHYNINRHYDPSSGRYIQSDPIGLAGGLASYSYVDSAPLQDIDLLGLKKVILFGERDPMFLQRANEYKDDPNACLVYSHGSPSFIYDTRGSTTKRMDDPQQIVNLLKAEGCTSNMPVIIYACRTGMGDNSIAEDISKTGAFPSVTAPTSYVWYNQDPTSTGPSLIFGKTANGTMDTNSPGSMRTFP